VIVEFDFKLSAIEYAPSCPILLLSRVMVVIDEFDDEIKVAIQKHLSVTKKQQKKI